jgi:hypothetical protein
MSRWLGFNAVVSWDELSRLVALLVWNLAFASVVIRLVYYRLYKSREYVFTYYLFNVITFCLCVLLRRVAVEFGFALALFGVFGILRYRTEQIRIRELTYLFIVIGIGILNAVAGAKVSFAELFIVNMVIVGMTALLERGPSERAEEATSMCYDRLELLRPGNEAKLTEDVAGRTCLHVLRVEVQRIDLLRDAAEITIWHRRVH